MAEDKENIMVRAGGKLDAADRTYNVSGNPNFQKYLDNLGKAAAMTICGKSWREETTFLDPNYHGN